jgi:hypothetical protein
VKSNSLVQGFKSNGQIPNMHRNGQSVIIRHKEYISDITSTTGFGVYSQYPLNPGLSVTFPWLSTIAQQYQEYTWKGVIFEFRSTSGDVVASSNTALGSVMMATNYRGTAPVYTNKLSMLNEYFSSDAKPSEDFCHPIECDPRENPYNVQYVRGAAVPAGEDEKTYDLGIMSIATEGMQASSVDIGELWVSYEVELRKPVVSGATDLFGKAAHYYASSGAAATTPFSTARTSLYDSIGLVFTSTKVTFPLGTIGTFIVVLAFGGTITVANFANAFTSGTLTNCTAATSFNGSTSNNPIAAQYTASGTSAGLCYAIVTIPDSTLQASITPSITTLTGASTSDISVFQIAPSSI